MTDAHRFTDTAARLRRDFDRGFAEAPMTAASLVEDVLMIRIGNDPFVLRLSEIAGLHTDRVIAPIPSPVSELLGIVAIRGVMAPVYDLGGLLGYPVSQASRWLALAHGPKPAGFAFEVFEAHARVSQESFAAHETDSSSRTHLQGAVRIAGVVRPVIHIASVLEAIARRARAPSKEQ